MFACGHLRTRSTSSDRDKKTDDPFELAVAGANENDALDLLGGMAPRTPPGMDDVAAPSTPVGLDIEAMDLGDLADESGLDLAAPPTQATRPMVRPPAGPSEGASAPKTPRVTAPAQLPAATPQRPQHAALYAGSVGSLTTVDENLDMNLPEMDISDENLGDDHRLCDDDDETYTHEMETSGMKKELERLKEFGLYSVINKDSRDPGGRFIPTTWMKKAKSSHARSR